jgi:hypothetical protein
MLFCCLNFSGVVVYFEKCKGLNRYDKFLYKTPSKIFKTYYYYYYYYWKGKE